MYLVTKRIEFCYGHRLLDYDGICKHPHGHNAVAEIDVRTDALDRRNMVADFSDIKRLVKGWIDQELDHKMILRQDDPLVGPLRELGEPMYLLESNPTVERIARLIFEKTQELGFQRRVGPRLGDTELFCGLLDRVGFNAVRPPSGPAEAGHYSSAATEYSWPAGLLALWHPKHSWPLGPSHPSTLTTYDGLSRMVPSPVRTRICLPPAPRRPRKVRRLSSLSSSSLFDST